MAKKLAKAEKDIFKRVAEVEDARCAAMIDRDQKMLSKLLDDQFSYGHTSGYWDTKEILVAKLARKDFQYRKFKIIERNIRRQSGVFISFGTMYAEYESKGRVTRQVMVFHAVYADDKDLKCLALHVNRIVGE